MKHFRIAAAVAAAALTLSGCGAARGSSHSDGYPSRPVQLVVPFPAGGGTDALARPFAEEITSGKLLGEDIKVVNREGAAATLGVNQVLTSPADGQTLGVAAASTFAVTPKIMNVPWQKDAHQPIRMLATYEIAFVVGKNSKYTSARQILETAKEKPGSIKVGTAGTGTDSHFALLALQHAGYDFTDVPFEGNAPALTALLGGNIDALSVQLGPVLRQIQSGDVRPLAVSGSEPSGALPQVPTWKSLGVDAVVEGAFFVVGPKGLPEEVVAKVSDAFAKAAESDKVQKLVAQGGYKLDLRGPEETKRFIENLEKQATELMS